MVIKQTIESRLTAFPICEYAFIKEKDLSFLDQVRYICETECPQYGKSWSCPPAVGTVAECKERCSRFQEGFLFTFMAEVSDLENMEEMLATRKEHEEITRQVREVFTAAGARTLTLSAESCAICERCAYPDASCRYPDKMFPCIESHGILVTELAEKHGITFMSGGNVVIWFSLILYQ